MKKLFISDMISTEDIDSWNSNRPVIIDAQTGAGKTHFIMEKLYTYAKQNGRRILLLTHRRPTRDQFQIELDRGQKTDVIKVETYQKVDKAAVHDKPFNLDRFSYIVCDEDQYFFDDAGFNYTTDCSFNAIMKSDAVKIFMSATGAHIERYIRGLGDVVKYQVPRTWDHIQGLHFYASDAYLRDEADRILDEGKKAIFFINNKEKALALYRDYCDQALFAVSQSESAAYTRYMDDYAINKMLEDEKFDCPFLIATSVLSAGVNIKDPDITDIFLDIKEMSTLIQCLGRRRILNQEDKICVHVRKISIRQIRQYAIIKQDLLAEADFLRKYGHDLYYREYAIERNRQSQGLIFLGQDRKYHVNNMRYGQLKEDLSTYKYIEALLPDIKGRKIDCGWERFVTLELGQYDPAIDWYFYDTAKTRNLKEYLQKIEGVVLLEMCDRQPLIRNIGLRDQKGKPVKGINVLNEYLKIIGITYHIEQKRIQINGKRFSAAWIVQRNT